MTYIGYYVASLLFNSLLFVLYVVQVFSKHHPCLMKTGENITRRYQIMFAVGLALLGAEMINTNICNIYYRYKAQIEDC